MGLEMENKKKKCQMDGRITPEKEKAMEGWNNHLQEGKYFQLKAAVFHLYEGNEHKFQ